MQILLKTYPSPSLFASWYIVRLKSQQIPKDKAQSVTFKRRCMTLWKNYTIFLVFTDRDLKSMCGDGCLGCGSVVRGLWSWMWLRLLKWGLAKPRSWTCCCSSRSWKGSDGWGWDAGWEAACTEWSLEDQNCLGIARREHLRGRVGRMLRGMLRKTGMVE